MEKHTICILVQELILVIQKYHLKILKDLFLNKTSKEEPKEDYTYLIGILNNKQIK